MIGVTSVAAATAIVGYDICQNQIWQQSDKPRFLRALACVGGNAINEANGDLYIGTVYVGTYYNTKNGVVAPIQEDIKPLGKLYVPPGAKIMFIVRVAPTVSPIILELY